MSQKLNVKTIFDNILDSQISCDEYVVTLLLNSIRLQGIGFTTGKNHFFFKYWL